MNRRSAYTLAITTPLNAMIAIASFALKTPSRIKNSPTKFDEPGIASVASDTIRKMLASTGARNAMPPMSRTSSEPPARRPSTAAMNSAGATTSPWLNICSSAPCAPCGFSAKIPSRMKPSCATDEYPRIRRAFVWLNACSEPYTIDTSAISSISVWKCTAARGNSGSTIARKPYAPTFDSTPENTIRTSTGIAR